MTPESTGIYFVAELNGTRRGKCLTPPVEWREAAQAVAERGYRDFPLWSRIGIFDAITLVERPCKPCPRCGDHPIREEGWTCDECYGRTHHGGVYKPKGQPKLDILSPIVREDGELRANCLRCGLKDFPFFEAQVIVLGWWVPQMVRTEMRGLDDRGKPKRWYEMRRVMVPRTLKGLGCPACWQVYAEAVVKGEKFIRLR